MRIVLIILGFLVVLQMFEDYGVLSGAAYLVGAMVIGFPIFALVWVGMSAGLAGLIRGFKAIWRD